MKFIIAALFAGLVAAAPASDLEDRQVYIPCSGLYGTAQCCATDVLGIADLDCGNRMFSPHRHYFLRHSWKNIPLSAALVARHTSRVTSSTQNLEDIRLI